MMRSNLKNKTNQPKSLATKKSEKNLKSSWDFRQAKPEKRISFNLIENLEAINDKELGKEKCNSGQNSKRKLNQRSLTNRNHRKESSSQLKALFLSDLSRKHYNNDVEEEFFRVNSNKANSIQYENKRATSLSNNGKANKKSLTDFEIKMMPHLSTSGLVDIPTFKTFQYGSKYQIMKNYYNLKQEKEKEKEKEIQRLPTNKTFMSNSSKKAEVRKEKEANIKRPSYFNYYNNALIESERVEKEGKEVDLNEFKEERSSNQRSKQYKSNSDEEQKDKEHVRSLNNFNTLNDVEQADEANMSNDTIRHVKQFNRDINLSNHEKTSNSKSDVNQLNENTHKRTLSSDRKRNAHSITSKESEDSNYSSDENIYNRSISTRSYRKKSGKSIKFMLERSSILSSKSRVNPILSLNQKRRQTYLNYRSSINNTTNSKRQSIFEFRYFQKAIEESSSNSEYESYTKYFKIVEIALGIIALINIFCAILDTQLYISRKDELVDRTSKLIIFMVRIEMETLSPGENFLRFIMIFTSLLLVILVYFRYKLQVSLRIIDQQLSRFDNMYTSGDMKYFIFEAFISGICYPPFVDAIIVGKVNQYDYIVIVNAIISMLTIVKVYHILRNYKYISKYKNLQAVSICNKHGVKNDLLFAFKAEIKSRPFVALTLFIVFFVCLTSFCLRTFENGVVISTDYLIENNLQIPYMNEDKLVELKANLTLEIAEEELENSEKIARYLELSRHFLEGNDAYDRQYLRQLDGQAETEVNESNEVYSYNARNKTSQLTYIDYLLNYDNMAKTPLANTVSIARIIRKGTNNLSYLFNSMWFIIESITTVSYGELFPKTHLGRAVSAVSCLFGIFLLSLVTASFSAYTEFTSEERKAYIIIKQLQFENNLKIKAWLVVKSILEINRMKQENKKKLENKNSILTEKFHKVSKLNYGKHEKHHKNHSHLDTKTKSLKDIKGKNPKDDKHLRISSLANQFLLFTQLKKDLSNFKNETKLTNKVVPIDEMFSKMRKKLSGDLYKLEFNVSQLKILEPSFIELKKCSIENEKKIDDILGVQEKIMNYVLSFNNICYQSNLQVRKKFLASQKSSTMLQNYNTDIKPDSTKSNVKISNSIKENSQEASKRSTRSKHSNHSSYKDIILKTKTGVSPKKNSKNGNTDILYHEEELFNSKLHPLKVNKEIIFITPINRCSSNFRSNMGFPENKHATGSFYKHRQHNSPVENEKDFTTKEKGFNSSYFRTDQCETDPNNQGDEDKNYNARRIRQNDVRKIMKEISNNHSYKNLQPTQSNSCKGKLKEIFDRAEYNHPMKRQARASILSNYNQFKKLNISITDKQKLKDFENLFQGKDNEESLLFYYIKDRSHSPQQRKSKLSIKSELMKLVCDLNNNDDDDDEESKKKHSDVFSASKNITASEINNTRDLSGLYNSSISKTKRKRNTYNNADSQQIKSEIAENDQSNNNNIINLNISLKRKPKNNRKNSVLSHKSLNSSNIKSAYSFSSLNNAFMEFQKKLAALNSHYTNLNFVPENVIKESDTLADSSMQSPGGKSKINNNLNKFNLNFNVNLKVSNITRHYYSNYDLKSHEEYCGNEENEQTDKNETHKKLEVSDINSVADEPHQRHSDKKILDKHYEVKLTEVPDEPNGTYSLFDKLDQIVKQSMNSNSKLKTKETRISNHSSNKSKRKQESGNKA